MGSFTQAVSSIYMRARSMHACSISMNLSERPGATATCRRYGDMVLAVPWTVLDCKFSVAENGESNKRTSKREPGFIFSRLIR